MNLPARAVLSRRADGGAMTLVEVMVGVGLASIVLLMIMGVWLFGVRSFTALSNYTDLDAKSRFAVDLMSRDIRQAVYLVEFNSTSTNRWLKFATADTNVTIVYRWDGLARTFMCKKTGEPEATYLTECDRWDFQLYQRTPQGGANNLFFPATNAAGVYDPTICKLVDMTWKCSRQILGNKVNTESVQTAQVVLRNKT